MLTDIFYTVKAIFTLRIVNYDYKSVIVSVSIKKLPYIIYYTNILPHNNKMNSKENETYLVDFTTRHSIRFHLKIYNRMLITMRFAQNVH